MFSPALGQPGCPACSCDRSQQHNPESYYVGLDQRSLQFKCPVSSSGRQKMGREAVQEQAHPQPFLPWHNLMILCYLDTCIYTSEHSLR